MMNQQELTEALSVARFRSLIEETLFPSPNSVEFTRTPQNEYILRFGNHTANIAELFQENTKLIPYSTMIGAFDEQEYQEARKWYFTSSYRIKEEDLKQDQTHYMMTKHHELPEPIRTLFAPFAEEGDLTSLLFSVDLFYLSGNRLVRQVPQTDYLWFEKNLTQFEQQLFRSSLLRVPQDKLADTKDFLILVGVPWRYMMFFGPRGYRKMMYEAGALMNRLAESATKLGLGPILCDDFFDARVDRVMLMDGTERTTLAIIPLTGGETNG